MKQKFSIKMTEIWYKNVIFGIIWQLEYRKYAVTLLSFLLLLMYWYGTVMSMFHWDHVVKHWSGGWVFRGFNDNLMGTCESWNIKPKQI